MNAAPVHFTIVSADSPGPVGMIQLHGPGAAHIVEQLTGRPPTPACRVCDLGGIDEGIAVALRDDWCQLMPHGGPRVMQLLVRRLRDMGAAAQADIPPATLYPEASSDLEADMLATLARAASPAAIDVLLDQPRRWAEAVERDDIDAAAIVAHSDRLDHLVNPPSVVVVGRANVGKSTLTNWTMGRAASLTADLPGTTRDWVGGLAELLTPVGGLAVHWLDTPGLRASEDVVEQHAIALASRVIDAADVLIVMRDPDTDWPDPGDLPRCPDLWVMNKADQLDADASAGTHADEPAAPGRLGRQDCPLRISALHGSGIDVLHANVAEGLDLGAGTLDQPIPWAFSRDLRDLLAAGDHGAISRYIQSTSQASAGRRSL